MQYPTRAGLPLLAAMTLAFAVSSLAVGAPAPPAVHRAQPDETSDAGLAARESRLMNWIHVGRMEGWLDRPEAHERYRTLSGIVSREAEMRKEHGGGLSEAGRMEIDLALKALAQDLRWTRDHNRPHYRPH